MNDDIFERWNKFINEGISDWEDTEALDQEIGPDTNTKHNPNESATDIAREIAWAMNRVKREINTMIAEDDKESLSRLRDYYFKGFDLIV